MIEIWKPIPGFEALYHVSNLGFVKSIGVRSGRAGGDRILIPRYGKYGHCRVQLCRRLESKVVVLIHRLVALAFLPQALPGQIEVHHIDFDPTNNRVDNLMWTTHQQNSKHSCLRFKNRRGEAHHNAKLTSDDIAAIKARYDAGGISFVKLGKLYDICGQQCHRIVRGLRWKTAPIP